MNSLNYSKKFIELIGKDFRMAQLHNDMFSAKYWLAKHEKFPLAFYEEENHINSLKTKLLITKKNGDLLHEIFSNKNTFLTIKEKNNGKLIMEKKLNKYEEVKIYPPLPIFKCDYEIELEVDPENIDNSQNFSCNYSCINTIGIVQHHIINKLKENN